MATITTVLTIITALSNAASISTSHDSQHAVPDSKYKRVCYYTNWSQYRKPPARFLPFNIDPFLCTHLIFSFSKIDYNGHLAPYEWNDISYPHMYRQFNALKKKNPKLRTLLAVGGWTHGSKPFTEMVATDEGRHSFIDHAIQYLRTHNFDGLDLDWEYPANRGSPKEDKHKFSELCQELEQAFKHESKMTGKERLLLTAAVGGGKKIVLSAYEVPEISKHLDFINLMSYDLFGGWSKTLGTNAGLYPPSNVEEEVHPSDSVHGVVQLWLELGADPSKLVMGIPLYGRSFTLCSADKINVGDKNCGVGNPGPYTREKGFLAYYEIMAKLKSGYTRKWLDDQKVPIAFNVQEKQWIGYDDEQSVKLKAEYIKKNNLAGAMMWAVDLDDFNALEGVVYPLTRRIRSTLEGDVEFPEFDPPPKPDTKRSKQRKRPRIMKKKPTLKPKTQTAKPKQTKPYKSDDKKNGKEVSSATFKGPSRVPIVTHPSILVHTVHDNQPFLRTTTTSALEKSTSLPTRIPTEMTTKTKTTKSVSVKNKKSSTKNDEHVEDNRQKITSTTAASKQTSVQKSSNASPTIIPITTSPKTQQDQVTVSLTKQTDKDSKKLQTTTRPHITLEPASISLWDSRKSTVSFRTSNRVKATKNSDERKNSSTKPNNLSFGARTETSTTPTTKSTISYPWPKSDKNLSHTRSSTPPTTASVTSTTHRNIGSVTVDKDLLAYIESSKGHTTTSTASTLTTHATTKNNPFKKIFKKYRKKLFFPTRQPRIPKSEVKFPFIHTNNIIWTLKKHPHGSTSPGPRPSTIAPTAKGINNSTTGSTHPLPKTTVLTTPRQRTTRGQLTITKSAITRSDKHKITQNPRIHMTTRKVIAPQPYEIDVHSSDMTTSDPLSTTETSSIKTMHSVYDKTLKQSPFSRKEYENRQEAERKRLGNAENNINIDMTSRKKTEGEDSRNWNIGGIKPTTGMPTSNPWWSVGGESLSTTKGKTIESTSVQPSKLSVINNATVIAADTMKIKPEFINTQVTKRPVAGIFTDLQNKFQKNKKKWSTRKTHIFKATTPVYSEVVLKKTTEKRTNYITLRRHRPTTKKINKGSIKPIEITTKPFSKDMIRTLPNLPLTTKDYLPSSGTSRPPSASPTTVVTIQLELLKKKNGTSTVATNATNTPDISATTTSSINNDSLVTESNYTDWYLLESFVRTQPVDLPSPTVPEPQHRELPGLKRLNLGALSNEVQDKKSEFRPFFNPLNRFAYTEIRHPIDHDPRFGLLKIPRENKVYRTKPPQGIYGLMTMSPKTTTPHSTKKIDEGDIIIQKGREKLYQYVYHTTESPLTMPWDTPNNIFKKKHPKKLRNIFARPSKFNKEKRKPKGKWDLIKTLATSQNFNTPTQIPQAPVVPIRRSMPLDKALYNLDEEYKYNNINDMGYRHEMKYEVDTPQVIIRRPSDKEVYLDDFHCPNVFGIFADQFNCQRFYQCVWFVSFHHTCGQGTVWNDNLKICDWPAANSCIS